MLIVIVVIIGLLLAVIYSGAPLLDLLIGVVFLELFIYLLVLIKVWFHVIILMLFLEFFSLKAFLLCTIKRLMFISPMIIFIFSVLMVCEARIGMGLVVRLTRERGGEAAVI